MRDALPIATCARLPVKPKALANPVYIEREKRERERERKEREKREKERERERERERPAETTRPTEPRTKDFTKERKKTKKKEVVSGI